MRESIQLARRLPKFKRDFTFGTISGAMAGLLAIAQAPILATVINGAFLRHESLAELRTALSLWIALLVSRALLAWFASLRLSQTAVHIKAELRRQLLRKLLSLEPSARHLGDTGDLANVIGEGVEGVEGFLTKYLPQVVYVSILPLATLAVVYRFDLISGIIFSVSGPLIVIFMILIGMSTQKTNQRRWKTLSILSGHFLDTLRGLTTLKLFNRSGQQVEVVRRLSEQYREETMKTLRVAFMSSFVLELFATLGTAMAAVGIGLRLLSGQLTLTAGLTVLVLAGEFFLPLRNMGAEFHTAMNGISGLSRVFEILDYSTSHPTEGEPNQGQPSAVTKRVPLEVVRTACRQSSNPIEMPPTITFDGVTYQHPNTSQCALVDISFRALPGTMTALVGPSGTGKSTLLGLLMGFTTPSAGQICIDNLPLNEDWVKNWRKRVMYIPQHPYLFQGSIMDNLRFAKPSADKTEVLAAANKAGVSEMVKSMGAGYDSIIGGDGYGLSGGEAQRIAIARAILHGGDVLVMDEPSAHLDLESERWLRTALQELTPGRTTLVIAHRLSTIADANHVVVLSNGRIAQAGHPARLLKNDGPYKHLVDSYSMSQERMLLS